MSSFSLCFLTYASITTNNDANRDVIYVMSITIEVCFHWKEKSFILIVQSCLKNDQPVFLLGFFNVQ